MSRLDYWNHRATLGPVSGTEDRIAKELEIRYLARWMPTRGRVLDAGCGDGETLARLQQAAGFEAFGCDFSSEMLNRARMVRGSAITWYRQDLREPIAAPRYHDALGYFDLIYTERALINLASREQQLTAITHLAVALEPGGLLVLVECSADGLEVLNRTRARVGLEPITPPWHNCYLWADDVHQAGLHAGLHFVRMDCFSDTYYFLSRVVEAKVAQQEGRAPRYDSVINQLALSLDVDMSLGVGQGRGWVFRKP